MLDNVDVLDNVKKNTRKGFQNSHLQHIQQTAGKMKSVQMIQFNLVKGFLSFFLKSSEFPEERAKRTMHASLCCRVHAVLE